MARQTKVKVSFHIFSQLHREVLEIAEVEGLDEGLTGRLLLRLGVRYWKKGRKLLCGYDGCTRKDCCGRREEQRQPLVEFPRHAWTEPHHRIPPKK